MRFIGAIFGVLVGIIILEIIFSTICMYIGSKVAKINGANWQQALFAAIGSAVISWLVSLVLSIIPVIGTILGFILGVIAAVFVIKAVYSTTTEKAVITWLFNLMAKFIAIIISIFTFASVLLSMF